MAFRTKKISQMDPKGAPLSSTDLLEISELVSGSYVTKSITGQEIIDSVPPTSVEWGDIGGTLSAQTDLQSALNAKQDTLVSGTNIKTINSTSLLGSGNVAVQPTLVSGTNIKTINSTSLLGAGDIAVGTVTSVSGTAPIASTGGTTPTISIATANTTTTGALTSTDWNTFNGKQSALVSGTNIKTINGTSILGSGDLTISVATPTIDQVTTAGSTTTNRITIGGATTNGSVTASGAIARGNYFNNTLVAAANNDVLVGLDINPTFTNGAFTLTRNIGLRVQAGRVVIGSPSNDVSDYPASLLVASNYTLYGATPQHGGLWVTESNSGNFANIRFYSNGTPTFLLGRTGTTYGGMANKSFMHSSSDIWFTASSSGYPDSTGHLMVMFQSTRNIGINTTTDAGYKLDVNGTARVVNNILSGNGNYYNTSNQTIASTSNASHAYMEISGASGNNSSLVYSKGGLLSTVWQMYTDDTNNYAIFRNGINRQIFKIFESTKNVGIDEVAVSSSFSDIASAKLFVNSTTKGFLPPRMTTTQKNAIASPTAGLQVFDTTLNQMSYYNGSSWTNI